MSIFGSARSYLNTKGQNFIKLPSLPKSSWTLRLVNIKKLFQRSKTGITCKVLGVFKNVWKINLLNSLGSGRRNYLISFAPPKEFDKIQLWTPLHFLAKLCRYYIQIFQLCEINTNSPQLRRAILPIFIHTTSYVYKPCILTV